MTHLRILFYFGVLIFITLLMTILAVVMGVPAA